MSNSDNETNEYNDDESETTFLTSASIDTFVTEHTDHIVQLRTEIYEHDYCEVVAPQPAPFEIVRKKQNYDDLVMTKRQYKQQRKFINSEKIDNQYYIGLAYISPETQQYHIAACILPEIFTKNTHNNVFNYLKKYSIVKKCTPVVHIMQLKMYIDSDGFETECVVIKTFWLKILQRKWQRLFQKRAAAKNHIVYRTYTILEELLCNICDYIIE